MKTALLKVLTLGLFVGELALLSTCAPSVSKLEQIHRLGVLKVATINSPTTYYESGSGETGFEYDLALRFANWLGVSLQMSVFDSGQDALEAVSAQQAHLAAANLTITDGRSRNLLFSPAVRELTPKLVYHRGSGRPRSLNDLSEAVHIPEDSAHIELLSRLQPMYPNLQWVSVAGQSAEDLLAQVGAGELKFTIADSDLIAMTQRYYPQLAEVFDLSTPVRKAWAFRHHRDASLYNVATRFLTEMRDSGELAQFNDRYFGHVDRLDFVSSRTLSQHLETRLPLYREMFEAAGAAQGIDWRLLAAISYQESHWDAKAVSPTGVRGLMMLTRDTARFVKIKKRTDPQQSIEGGARYFRMQLDRIPASVPEPDRVWMALAAYNMGFGHLLDARELTRELGGNPDTWVDVRQHLELLSRPNWYRKTRYGYARGKEAEVYVGNIRTYLDVLNWISRAQETELAVPPAPSHPQIAPPAPRPVLDLSLPVL